MKPANVFKPTLLLLCLWASCTGAYGQKKQRIKQIWHINPESLSYSYIDSLVFHYSGNRGSVFNPHRFNPVQYGFPYDVPLYHSHYPAAPLPYPLHDIFDPTVQYDSMERFNRLKNDTVRQYIRSIITMQYEHDTNLVTVHAGYSAHPPLNSASIVYNQGLPTITYKIRLNTMTNTNDTFTTRYIAYDAAGRVLADSVKGLVYSDDVYFNYTYNDNGLVATITEQRPYTSPMYRYTITSYTYNAQGNVTNVLTQLLDEDVFVTLDRQVLAYDTDNRLTSYTSYEGDTMLSYKKEIFYDHYGDPYIQDIRFYTGGNPYSCEWVEFFFNEYHNPDSAITWVNHCNQGFTRRETTIYTYETYGQDTLPQKRKPFIYPNPARDVVHIRWNKDMRKTPLNIKLYNAQGQEMRSYHIAYPRTEDNINTTGLAAGVYLLRINTAAANEYIYSSKLVVL